MSDRLVLGLGAGAIFLAIGLVVVTLLAGSVGRSGVARALETIDIRYAPGSASPADESLAERIGPTVRQFSALGRAVAPRGAAAAMQRRLDHAGNPPGWPAERVVELQGLGLLVLAFAGAVLGWLLGLSPGGMVVAVLLGAALGFAAPFLAVYDRGVRRQQLIRRQLPDALDLLTLSVEAGLGFDAALAQVATAMPGPLAREFARMLQEMQMGQRRAEALRALVARTTVTELKTIGLALVQAGELGIPIAGVLREQARQMRVKRRQRAEETARKLPVKVIFPLVLCLFPALFIVVIGPGVLNVMAAFSR
ncbi:type II secretion system F family protein [Catellatospora sp. KI3]|uniref:type II secretion system F family protein n=1 Tax=Catellatospora sp. KI3 TaxID=3041620 RepID=UPI002482AC28|nr:type II secretion system F family protein [Catellatospora sp. KI3]MDI1461711.1 type II secretion system F family protein [Catellatospora sp. KI3]